MDCGPLYPLRILSRKWSYLVLRALQNPLHFSQLQKKMRFITNRVLSRELSVLQEGGLILQSNGEYVQTEKGAALVEAVQHLVEWSVYHGDLSYCPKEKDCSKCVHYTEMFK